MTHAPIRIGLRSRESPTCLVTVTALCERGALAVQQLLADGLPEISVERLDLDSGGEDLSILLIDEQGCRPEASSAIAKALASSADASHGSLVVIGREASETMPAVEAQFGIPVSTLACSNEPMALVEVVRAYASPLLRSGYIGFDSADLRAIIRPARRGRFLRLPIDSWSRRGSGLVAPQSFFAAPAGLQLAGVLLTIIADDQDPEFSLASLDCWLERTEEAIGEDAHVIFTALHEPGPPYALASAFFEP